MMGDEGPLPSCPAGTDWRLQSWPGPPRIRHQQQQTPPDQPARSNRPRIQATYDELAGALGTQSTRYDFKSGKDFLDHCPSLTGLPTYATDIARNSESAIPPSFQDNPGTIKGLIHSLNLALQGSTETLLSSHRSDQQKHSGSALEIFFPRELRNLHSIATFRENFGRYIEAFAP